MAVIHLPSVFVICDAGSLKPKVASGLRDLSWGRWEKRHSCYLKETIKYAFPWNSMQSGASPSLCYFRTFHFSDLCFSCKNHVKCPVYLSQYERLSSLTQEFHILTLSAVHIIIITLHFIYQSVNLLMCMIIQLKSLFNFYCVFFSSAVLK